MSVERAISLLHDAIAELSGGQNFPATQAGVDAASAQYLRENPDVAGHVYFAKHPLEHWQLHGKHEGRKWPSMTPPVEDQRPTEATVTTPGGRQFPAPDPRENAFGYIGRVGKFLNREAEWNRVSGTLFLGSDHLVPKTVPRETYKAWKEDLNNWPTMAENFWFPPAQVTDPGWQQVHDGIKDQRAKPAEPQLPPGEEPL